MKQQINPAWLVSLMSRWSLRQLRGETSALGYPSKAAGFSEKTTGGYSHTNPTAFGVEDFRDLDAALKDLCVNRQWQFAAMMMYYKPWIVQNMKGEGYPFNDSTYYKRLHSAHEYVARLMDAKNDSNVYAQTIEQVVKVE